MTIRHRVGLAAAVAGSAIAGAVLPSVAHAADQSVLHVDNAYGSACSDAGSGAQDRPFCTVQAAVDAAQPGQTVQVATGGSYRESVTVRHSGLPGRPIVIKADIPYGMPQTILGIRSWDAGSKPAAHALVFSGVHDVTVSGFQFEAPQEGVLVQDADRIVVNRNTVLAGDPVFNGVPSSYPDPAPAVRITGKTTATTVSRTRVQGQGTVGIAVDAGVSGTVITTDLVVEGRTGGVVATDAPGTVVASNTFAGNCGNDVLLAGSSSGAAVTNNVITKLPAGSCTDEALKSAAGLSVSAGSVPGTKADYNSVVHAAGGVGYLWGGTPYTAASDFRATGQGAHDNEADPKFGFYSSDYAPRAVEGLTDAADATAPGMLDTDFYDHPRADHPAIANTGTGPGYYDRGAVELQDDTSVQLSAIPYATAGHPLNARIQTFYRTGWAPAGAKLDFGDGSTPVDVNPGSGLELDHDYPAPGTYTATLTATSRTGLVFTGIARFTFAPVGALRLNPQVSVADQATARVAFHDATSSPWPVARYAVDFGDGTAPVVTDGRTSPDGLTHDYGVGGYYTVTETVTDDHGRQATVSVQASVPGPQAGTPFTGYLGGPATQVGLFDNGRWNIDYGKTTGHVNERRAFGEPGDVPVVGAWENTCQCQLGIYRPSTATFGLQLRDGSVTAVRFGEPGDVPVAGAWDHNGHDQLAVYRPATGTLAVRHDDTSVTTLQFGGPGDLPVAGDWDGVHHAQFGLFRPGRSAGEPNTFLLRHDDGSVSTASYGVAGDLPVVGDWQAAGRTTFGIFRPGSHVFALSNAYVGRGDTVFTLYV
ncbi:PKD domain-containing protein [Kitasatospora sp. NPDC059747]|uniref:PKD domain-containing protein n=1 Tax=Kitasatospora sp. NPDC059747 TaxID=3346930 RepID=UPI003661B8E3